MMNIILCIYESKKSVNFLKTELVTSKNMINLPNIFKTLYLTEK